MIVKSLTTMLVRALRGFQINQAIGGVAELLSFDQVYSFSGPALAVCNTSSSNTCGTHWVVICIDKEKRGEFFDSFGMPPMAYGFEDSMEHTQQLIYNDFQLQHPTYL